MSLFARRRGAPGPPTSPHDMPAAPITPEAGTPFTLSDEHLPSRIPTLRFTISVNGTWTLANHTPLEHHAPNTIARNHIREHAARILRRHTILAIPAAQDAVNAVIGRRLSPQPGLTVSGTAALTVSDTDHALAQEHLRHAQRGDLEREEIRRRITFLRNVLSDPAQLTVWWIDQYPERLTELAQVQEAVRAVTPSHDSEQATVEDEVAWFVDQLLAEMRTPQQREVFLRALTQTLHALGSTGLQNAAARWLPSSRPDPGADTP
ncbi:hypothetical protein [Streptomyces californicus]|uniref:hypothetical protein n=1 Tax=Streptomyces californicus TaxID=67351 RepID=UPI003716796D